jgi:anaerobic ribonucleoside-triphosphate reductase activating protein
MKLSLSRVHYPVTTLGPGRRIGIWLQGCTIGCAGCISRDTWSSEGGVQTSVEAVLEWIEQAVPSGFDGVTISGGEPFQQPEALAALLDGLHELRGGAEGFDLLAYSGYAWRLLSRRYRAVLSRLDAVIPGPFIASESGQALWRGSRNQQIVALSPLGRSRYGEAALSAQAAGPPAVQIAVEADEVFYVGIPRPGDMDRIAQAAARRGVQLGGASWLA